MSWKYTDKSNRVVSRTLPDGHQESCLTDAIADWIAAGNTPEPADIPDPRIAIQAQIDQIEMSTQENRGSREGWMQLIRERAAAMGITDDATIAAQNPYFKRLLEVDNLVRSLREQL